MEDFWPTLPPSVAPPVIVAERVSTPSDWADDVMWAKDRINLKTLDPDYKGGKGRPSKDRPESVSVGRFALWEFGRENPKEMMTNLVPKAIAILQKNTSRDNDEVTIAAEEKSVAEMRKILAAALVEAAVV